MSDVMESDKALSRRALLTGGTALAGLSCLGGCSTNPATGQDSVTGFYSLKDDVKMGQAEYPNLIRAFGGAYDSIPLQSYIARIGRDLASRSELPELPWEFTVLNTPIVNALALPGGKIAITRGLLAVASNEAEVAGVLAHEIGHVTARHTAQRQTRGLLANLGLAVLGVATQNAQLMQLGQTVASGYLQGFSRSQELQSDTLAVRYLSSASYDPEAMATFLSSLREHSQLEARLQGLAPGVVDQRNMMASHPRTIDRVRQAQAAAESAPSETTARLERDTYLSAINGMVFSDDPDQGYVRGRDFLHAGLKLGFQVPPGFVLRNGTSQVTAEDRNGAVITFDAAKAQRSRTLAEYVQNEWTQGVNLSDVQAINVNGLSAATGRTRLNTQQGVADLRVVAYQWEGTQLFRLMFLSPARNASTYGDGVRSTINSFRQLTDAEAAELKPLRLITVQAAGTDTISTLAQTMPYGALNDDWFRMLNDLSPGQPVPVGRSIKVVAS
ncbi:MAG: M48 family metalloprotease [Rhodospirillaceae bacterium]|jgi:predicted Zn-dependent protease|nr:M48 family metalloprotease [Rhodospirillaceae bacterium]MBT5240470.1 M48 family metalloprotease [Rhodospirillaceae bacterium]MBT5564965.1 M48 family metalloprotease [Rhodospirillaceae bacterium]MBT6090493.1 M48 family metalloprotease [Rhodospirillaceae bacterium]MBT6961689.1 M48 family metalloprotease [Rhodospirillaceae bacterium]